MSNSTEEVNNDGDKGGKSLLKTTSQGAGYLLIFNIISKVITFTMNQLILYFTKMDSFGIANIQFELLMSTILFLSREGVRCALLRVNEVQHESSSKEGKKSSNLNEIIKTQQFINISYIPIVMGALLSPVLYYIFSITVSKETLNYPGFNSTLNLYIISSLVELLSEPLYLLAQNQLNFRLRITIQGKALFGKSLVHFVLSYLNYYYTEDRMKYDLMCYGFAQLAYSVIILYEFSIHYYKLYGSLNCIVPRSTSSNTSTRATLIDYEIAKLCFTLTSQSIIKHILTEGDKLILTGVGDLSLQGPYGIVSRYGSLIARMVLQPIEEIARGLFSKLFNFSEEPKDIALIKEEQNNLTIGKTILATLFKMYSLVSLVIICFIPSYINCLYSLLKREIATLEPSTWNMILAYCCYLLVMAINGITEALVQSLASKSKLNQYNQYLILFSVIHISSAYVMLKVYLMGNLSLIIGNIINMGLRITWAIHFLLNFITHHQQNLFKNSEPKLAILRSYSLHPTVLFNFFTTFWINLYLTNPSEIDTLFGCIKALFTGVVVFLTNMVIVYLFEKSFLISLKNNIISRR
ncbi:Rft-1-domain-containing protein [Conidiobolus coronatus NRRL 28638]|uniref:Man(5)GlcNAc(2)-PP-dolichol translocation protein RFT1 n=1 Tax=Conidiobolus coronatus (strain ATCC 28846 / CBS 209.66 / NRRL 28638) TaxID=796925 RepID=A0A137P1M6_CONC2|nr:Rft-1-domain-containing protein [Conidiobolus coronatus NRRL 28638]|eukprot:KXN68965.1 Rft-1-domain-containing protein [Conidiobolus coronatus NRRL 28638]